MQGFLVYLFPEQGHGAGTVVATHAKFDVSYFPARKSDKRVHDFFTTLSCKNDSLASVSADFLDCDGLPELEVDANTSQKEGTGKLSRTVLGLKESPCYKSLS